MADIPKFDRDRAELEVGKYLLDPEAMNYHIEFKKRLAENPDMLEPEEKEGIFSFRTFVFGYIAYVFGEIIYKNTPLYDMVDLGWIPGWGPKAVQDASEAASDAVSAAADAASSVSLDAVQSTVDAASSVVEAVSNSM